MNLEMLRQSYEVVGYDIMDEETNEYFGGIQAIRTIKDAPILATLLSDNSISTYTYDRVFMMLDENELNSLCFIEALEVDSKYKQQGYGSELLNTLMNDVQADAYIIVPETKSLYDWCLSVGFEEVNDTSVLVYITDPLVEQELQESLKSLKVK